MADEKLTQEDLESEDAPENMGMYADVEKPEKFTFFSKLLSVLKNIFTLKFLFGKGRKQTGKQDTELDVIARQMKEENSKETGSKKSEETAETKKEENKAEESTKKAENEPEKKESEENDNSDSLKEENKDNEEEQQMQ